MAFRSSILFVIAASVITVACSTPPPGVDTYDLQHPFGTQSPWVRRPSLEDARRITPAAVRATHELQEAVLRCRVAAAGALENCRVDLETTPGIGLGEAALAAARLSALKSRLANGTPSEAHFAHITMVFDVGGPPDRTDHGVYPGLAGLYSSLPAAASRPNVSYDVEDRAVR